MAYGFTYTLPTISGTHTNLPVVLRAADFPAAAIDGGATSILNGGGNLRAYTDSSKATRLAVEVVSFVAGGSPSAQVWVKVPSASTGAAIYIEADAVETTQPAAGATYGRNAVWVGATYAHQLDGDPGASAPQMIDSSGNGNDGTCNGGMTSANSVAGKIGNGAQFDGVNDYISLPATATVATNAAFTISMWLKQNAFTNNKGILTLKASNNAAPFEMFVATAGGYLPFSFGSSNGGFAKYRPNDNFSADLTAQLNHLFLKYDGAGGYSLVWNGSSKTLASVTGAFEALTNASLVGALATNNYFWNGLIDGLVLFNSALSDDFGKTLHANQSAASAWGSVGTWADAGGGPTLITASDSLSASIGDSSTSDLLSSLSDSLACSISDVAGSISVVLSAADTVAAAIAESSTALVGVSVTDSVTAAITEAVSCFGTVSAADGLNLSTTEAVQLLCALAASDSVSMSTAEGLVAIASVVQVSDALGVSVADATVAVLALLARSDALDVSVAEAITLLGTINRSDSFNLSVSDQSQLAVLLQALDDLAVSVTDDAARQAIGQVVARLSAKLRIYPALSADLGSYPTLSGNPGVNDA